MTRRTLAAALRWAADRVEPVRGIVIVDSPRPEPGEEPPLPSYHDMLGEFCDRFRIPGSPTWWEAMGKVGEMIRDARAAGLAEGERRERERLRGIIGQHPDPDQCGRYACGVCEFRALLDTDTGGE